MEARKRGAPEVLAKMNEEDRYRSVFARVAQYQENVILTSMRKFLHETGWKEMA